MNNQMVGIAVVIVAALFSSAANAARIYHCRAYVGGEFFSTATCRQQQAVVLGMYDVPNGMPFDQQVALVRQRIGQTSSAQARDDQEGARTRECATVERQLQDLSKKYSSWRHVPVEEVNADQTREWQLKQRRSALRCY